MGWARRGPPQEMGEPTSLHLALSQPEGMLSPQCHLPLPTAIIPSGSLGKTLKVSSVPNPGSVHSFCCFPTSWENCLQRGTWAVQREEVSVVCTQHLLPAYLPDKDTGTQGGCEPTWTVAESPPLLTLVVLISQFCSNCLSGFPWDASSPG